MDDLKNPDETAENVEVITVELGHAEDFDWTNVGLALNVSLPVATYVPLRASDEAECESCHTKVWVSKDSGAGMVAKGAHIVCIDCYNKAIPEIEAANPVMKGKLQPAPYPMPPDASAI